MKKLIFALLLLPLAACFDADMTLTIEDENNATMKAVMQMGPEMYGMIAASGEDPCAEGVGEVKPDGGYTCTIEETDTIDNVIAELNAGGGDPDNPMDMAEGFSIERLDGGLIKVSFDLSTMRQDAASSGVDPAMMGSLMQAFEGHGMSITVAGHEVVETNGTLAEDGTSATIKIPLSELMAAQTTLPDSFDVIVNPN